MRTLVDTGVKILLGVGLIILFVLHFDSKSSIAYVDAQKLVMGYKGLPEAQQQFQVKATAMRARVDTLRIELEARVADYNKTSPSMTKKEKGANEELIRAKQDEYVRYGQMIEEQIKKQDEEISLQVLGKVNDYLKKYGQERGMMIILAATRYGNIAYAKDGLDITDDVMKGLNNEYGR